MAGRVGGVGDGWDAFNIQAKIVVSGRAFGVSTDKEGAFDVYRSGVIQRRKSVEGGLAEIPTMIK